MNGNNNFNTENFFGLQNLEALLSTTDAKKLGRDFGKKFAEGIQQAIESSNAVKNGLSDYQKSLKELKLGIKDTFKDLDIDDKTKRNFEASLTSAIQKAEKQADSLKTKLSDVYAEMEKESHKPVKDVEKMLKLYEQITGLQTEYNILTTTSADQIRLQADDLRYQVHYEEMLNQQRDLSIQKSEAKSKKDKEAIKDLEKKLDLTKSQLALEEQQNENARKSISERKSNYNEISNLDNQMFSDFKEGMEGAKKNTVSFFGTLKSGIDALSSYVNNIFETWNLLFNDTENHINRLNQEFGERWKIYNDVSKNIGGADFNEYQRGIYNAVNSGSMRGMFNEKELKEHLVTMSEYLFESKEAAIENSQLIAYGNKFLGLSSQSMQSIYNLEKLTNGDGFIRTQLETITKLQNSGLVTSQEQLNQLTIMASTVARDLTGLGLTGDAAKSLQTSFTEMGAVLDNKLYTGAGQEYMNTILDALKNPEKGIELFSDRYNQAIQVARSGDADAAWQLLSLMNDNALANNVQAIINEKGFGIESVTLGQQFANTSAWNNLDANWDQIQEDRALLNSMGYEGYLEAQQKKDSEVIDEDTKRQNEKAIELANGNYIELIKQAESTQRIESLVEEINKWTKVAGGFLSALTVLESIPKIFGKDGFFSKLGTGFKGLFGSGGKLSGSAGLGLGQGSGIWASAGSGGPGLFGAGMGTTVLGAGLTLAGAGWAAYDGITGGMNGVTDENGNYIMEKGFGTGVTTAIGGKKVNTEAYQGKLTEHAKSDNTWGSVGSGAAKGALIGAGIGTFFGPGIGTAIGGAIGGLVGGIAGLFAGDKKNKEAEEYAKKQYEEQKRLAEINQEMLDIAKRGNAALAYRYAIDTSVMGGPAMGGPTDAMGSTSSDVRKTGLLQKPWSVSRGYEMSTKYVDGKPTNEKTMHHGIDLPAPAGTPIGAAQGGIVTFSGWSNNGGGNQTHIKGDDGLEYWYLHQVSAPPVAVDQRVSQGQTIGFVGSTGNSSGNHLHFAVRSGGKYVDPIDYLNSSIFNATGVTDIEASASANSDLYDTSELLGTATMRTSSRTHFVASGGTNDGGASAPAVDISPIVAGLSEVNNTIKELGERQDAQQRILDALTVRPIPSLGI